MSPAPAAPEQQIVDSVVFAANGSTVAREYSIADLPRVAEAGGLPDTDVTVQFRFSQLDHRPAIHGALSGSVVLTCQRCLAEFSYALDESFELVVVNAEQDITAMPESHDPIVVDPTRVDLRWLAEEQVLLALPFAPKHESDEDCRAAAASERAAAATHSEADDRAEDSKQKPFANLRDLLGKR